MHDEEGDRSGQKPPPDPQEISPDLQDAITDAFAEALDLTVDEVQMRLTDGTKLWQIAQEELLSMDDVDDTVARVQEDVMNRAIEEGWVLVSDLLDLQRTLFCELFPAAEMGDGMARESRMGVLELIS
jgi:hypothetical protein